MAAPRRRSAVAPGQVVPEGAAQAAAPVAEEAALLAAVEAVAPEAEVVVRAPAVEAAGAPVALRLAQGRAPGSVARTAAHLRWRRPSACRSGSTPSPRRGEPARRPRARARDASGADCGRGAGPRAVPVPRPPRARPTPGGTTSAPAEGAAAAMGLAVSDSRVGCRGAVVHRRNAGPRAVRVQIRNRNDSQLYTGTWRQPLGFQPDPGDTPEGSEPAFVGRFMSGSSG